MGFEFNSGSIFKMVLAWSLFLSLFLHRHSFCPLQVEFPLGRLFRSESISFPNPRPTKTSPDLLDLDSLRFSFRSTLFGLTSNELAPKVQNIDKKVNELIEEGWKFQYVEGDVDVQIWYKNFVKRFINPSNPQKGLKVSDGKTLMDPLRVIYENWTD